MKLENTTKQLIPVIQIELQEPIINKVSEYQQDYQIVSEYNIKCPEGFGFTIGNAIRRTCMNSLVGNAIVAFRLVDETVKHLFDTIPGVKEIVQDIASNLSQVCIRLPEEMMYTTISLKKLNDTNSSLVVTAADFLLPEGVVISNPDQYICKLDLKKDLNMEVMVSTGIGHTIAEKQKFNHELRDIVAIDSIFSPVMKCAYDVQFSTGGKATYDNLSVTITTNGTRTGDEVMKSTTELLTKSFGSICNLKLDDIESETSKSSVKHSYAEYQINSTELDARIKNKLIQNNINTIADLAALTEAQLRTLGGLGEVCMSKIRKFLSDRGLCFGMNLNNGGI